MSTEGNNIQECKGRVQFYKKGKGFGYIREEGGKDRADDIFVHHSDVTIAGLKKLVPDQKIAYDIGVYDREVKKPDPDNEGEFITEVEEATKAINLRIIE